MSLTQIIFLQFRDFLNEKLIVFDFNQVRSLLSTIIVILEVLAASPADLWRLESRKPFFFFAAVGHVGRWPLIAGEEAIAATGNCDDQFPVKEKGTKEKQIAARR